MYGAKNVLEGDLDIRVGCDKRARAIAAVFNRGWKGKSGAERGCVVVSTRSAHCDNCGAVAEAESRSRALTVDWDC